MQFESCYQIIFPFCACVICIKKKKKHLGKIRKEHCITNCVVQKFSQSKFMHSLLNTLKQEI